METIERIKYHMNPRGWSEYRLAKEAGLSQSTISNIFKRNTLPSIPTLEIMCSAFGITLSQFFSNNDDTSSLSDEQKELLNKWVKLSSGQRNAILKLIMEITN